MCLLILPLSSAFLQVKLCIAANVAALTVESHLVQGAILIPSMCCSCLIWVSAYFEARNLQSPSDVLKTRFTVIEKKIGCDSTIEIGLNLTYDKEPTVILLHTFS